MKLDWIMCSKKQPNMFDKLIDIKPIRLELNQSHHSEMHVLHGQQVLSKNCFAVQICFYYTALFADADIARGDEGILTRVK